MAVFTTDFTPQNYTSNMDLEIYTWLMSVAWNSFIPHFISIEIILGIGEKPILTLFVLRWFLLNLLI